MAAANPQQGGFLTLVKKRNFLRLWLAQLISMTILNASNYALLVLVEEVTGSTTLVGLAIICFSLPAVFFGAPAGVVVDHLNKRSVLLWSNILRAIATFGFVISLLTNRHQLVAVYLLTLLIASIGQFFTPAEGASIPMLVSEDELVPALSLFSITFTLSQAVGFIILAPLVLSLIPTFHIFGVAIHSIDMLYFIIGVLYLVCSLLIALIPPSSFSRTTTAKIEEIGSRSLGVLGNVWREMSQGWSFIRRNNQLFLAVVQLSFAGVLLLVVGELATPLVTKLLQLSPNAMAFIFAPAGIGLVVGSIIMPRITRQLGKSRAIIIGSVSFAVVIAIIPLSTLLARHLQPIGWNTNPILLVFIAILMFIAGAALDFINIPAQTAIQEHTPEWIKGRVLALQLVLYNFFSIPVILFIGVLADIFGLDRVIYILAASVLAFCAWGIYYERKHPRSTLPDEATENLKKLLEHDRVGPEISH